LSFPIHGLNETKQPTNNITLLAFIISHRKKACDVFKSSHIVSIGCQCSRQATDYSFLPTSPSHNFHFAILETLQANTLTIVNSTSHKIDHYDEDE
jgi:hypothetical protein